MGVFGGQICTHADIVRKVAPNEEVKEILRQAMVRYQTDVLEIPDSKETRRWFKEPWPSVTWDLEELTLRITRDARGRSF